MANTRTKNVLRIDTSAQFTENLIIDSILYLPGSGSPSASIKADSSAGNLVWEAGTNVTTRTHEHGLDMHMTGGTYVSIAGTGSVIYLYLCDD